MTLKELSTSHNNSYHPLTWIHRYFIIISHFLTSVIESSIKFCLNRTFLVIFNSSETNVSAMKSYHNKVYVLSKPSVLVQNHNPH